MSGGSALSVSRALERALLAALGAARPALDLSAGGRQQLRLPALLGVRRSAQRGADYQTGLALQLGNQLREPPQALAGALVAALHDEDDALLREASVSNKGFVNLSLNDAWVARCAVRMATDGVQPAVLPASERRRVLVDFASPNLGKKLHVGHLRSSVIGDTICNLLEFRGHDVARVSHTGDVGAALATLLAELMAQRVPLATLSDAELGLHYEAGKKRAARDPAFKATVDDVVLQLQRLGDSDGDSVDPRLRETWQRACQVSREAYAAIFARLKVRVEERGESTYLRLVPATLARLKASGLAVESRGALCVFVDGPDKPPMLVQKRDGGFLYATVDLACLHARIHGLPGVDETPYDELLYVTDQSQELHFQHLFAAARAAGWTTRAGAAREVALTHASFGLVLGKDGSKLSSRNGAFDYLEDLLDEAANECGRRALAGGADSAALNRVVGDAAVRYFELSQQRERNYKFLFDNVLNLKGNTGVYLMYASARLSGILRKAEAAGAVPAAVRTSDSDREPSWDAVLRAPALRGGDAAELLARASGAWDPSERALALLLCQFDDEVTAALAHLYPHYLCDYLFRVVSHFHAFYERCRVLQDPKQDSRLLLCAVTDAVLRRGLQLVGIEAVKRM
ncbi:hypothetical protein PybrP1_013118 [[Pythium] brassicae (nom. inval.)]|nr:hypothetical protein PybrP1_013118 [[Pythium] brassicae (nom. inval.)]